MLLYFNRGSYGRWNIQASAIQCLARVDAPRRHDGTTCTYLAKTATSGPSPFKLQLRLFLEFEQLGTGLCTHHLTHKAHGGSQGSCSVSYYSNHDYTSPAIHKAVVLPSSTLHLIPLNNQASITTVPPSKCLSLTKRAHHTPYPRNTPNPSQIYNQRKYDLVPHSGAKRSINSEPSLTLLFRLTERVAVTLAIVVFYSHSVQEIFIPVPKEQGRKKRM